MRSAVEIAGAAARDRVLVFGSLPPEGRDLDLLVRPADGEAIASALLGEGFTQRGHELARFAGCSVEAVELIDAMSWGLPVEELDALFAEALPLDGSSQVVRPAPHHAVLILARRVAGDGALDEKRHARLEKAITEDPEALARARSRASTWGASAAVGALERLRADGGGALSSAELDHAAAERPARPASLRAMAGQARARLHSRRGAVITLSGLDGAGKSSQAAALRETLERLGYEVETAWTRINWDDLVAQIGVPLRRLAGAPFRLLARLRGGEGGSAAGSAGSPSAEPAPDPVKQARESSALLTHAWLMVIAFANGWSQRRLTRHHVRAGKVVICDRYTLDSMVALRYQYGRDRRFRVQRALIRALSPTPKLSYYLDVSPETAFARKGEWGLEWLTAHRELYLEDAQSMHVRILDGELPREDICAEIAREVWLAL
ncbi:MAG: dTMP kinase [Thermoleophilaceae bacterium]